MLERDPRIRVLADRWAVREYVRALAEKRYLSEVYAVISSISDLQLQILPDRFVAKATHQSGNIYFVSDKSTHDRDLVRILGGWLSSSQGSKTGEYWYAEMPQRIIFEEWLIQVGLEVPLEYKFFVFHGRVEAVEVDFGPFTRRTKNIYSREWSQLPVTLACPSERTHTA